jgi:exoribonuclease R
MSERQKYLEDELVFTIDGPETKAFDDAISL